MISIVCIIILIALWLRYQIICDIRAEKNRAISRANDKLRVQEMHQKRQNDYINAQVKQARRGSEPLEKKRPVPVIKKVSATQSVPAIVTNVAPDPTNTQWFLCSHKDLPAPSSAEALIIEELNKYNIQWHREVSFKGLMFTPYSWPRYDFYIPSLNMVLEYDGRSAHSNEQQLATDKAKDKFCNDNGIKIVRLNAKHYYNMYGAINALMKSAGIKKKPHQ